MTALLILDDAIFRTVLTAHFQMAGWQVIKAPDGASGINSALVNRPRFVVCDLVIPNDSGLGVFRRLRAEPGFKETIFVMYAANKDQATREMAFAAGADVFVQKPVRLDDVLALVQFLKSHPAEENLGAFRTPRIFFPDQIPVSNDYMQVVG